MESLIPIFVVPTFFAFVLAIGPFREPIKRWINRKADGSGGALHEDIIAHEDRLAEAERRIMELEERVDFAERLLSAGDKRPEQRATD